MEKQRSPHTVTRPTHVARTIVLLLSVLLVLSVLAPVAYAEWDGSGDVSGGTSGTISGDFVLQKASVVAVSGYRFSVHDSKGAKVGNSVDIHFEDDLGQKGDVSPVKRTYREHKKSHIELYREYLDTGTVDLQQLSTDISAAAYVLFDDTLPDIPADVEAWLTPTQAAEITSLCDADAFSLSTSYIICEPLFEACVDGTWYTMTLAEYAVYQSSQYGWGWDNLPAGWTSGTYSAIMRQLSAYFGRFLYAEENYPVFKTKPVPESALKKDYMSNDSILLGSSNRYNAASAVLEYQMGMAIYTDVLPSHELTIDPNGGLYNGSNSVSTELVQAGTQLIIPNPMRAGYAFAGWEVEGSGTLSGTFYTQGNGPCTLTAQWDVLTDKPYKVNHYQMTVDGDGYELIETTTGTGLPGEILVLEALAASYDHFAYTEGKVGGEVVSETAILADGSLVIDLYYSRNKYKLSLKGELDGVQKDNIEGCGTVDIYINGALVADDVSSYDEEHYYGSQYKIMDSKTPPDKKYLSEDEIYGHMTSDQTVTLRYGSAYTLTVDPNGGLFEGKTEPTEITVFYGDTTTINNPTRTGYSFSHWNIVDGSANVLPLDGSTSSYRHATKGPVRISAVWNPSYSTRYTVNHHLMGLDGKTYELAETAEYSGTTDTTVPLAVLAKSLPGFTYSMAKVNGEVATETTILADGSRVIDLYYSRTKHNLSLKGFLDGTETDGIKGYGTVDVYINGELVADDVSSYNGEHYWGSTYEITDIKTASGKAYNGVHSGELSGVISGDIVSVVKFSTKYKLTVDPNGGTWYYDGVAYTEPHTIIVSAFTEIMIEPPTQTGQLFRQWVVSNDTCSLTAGKYLHGTGDCTIVAVWAAHKYPVTALNGYTRFIKYKYLDTLDPNSKWRQKTLYSILEKALKNDLSDTSESQQVWHFSSEDYDTVHEWCLDNDKGEQTNKDFLDFLMDPEGLAGKNKIQ